jgi:thimet oligopeptidase
VKYSPYPFEKDTYEYANFGHLEGYSSMYYTYMWSLVLAKDLFTKFKADGLMNKATALSYRKAVLLPGGSVDAAVMVKNFLGRDYSFDAFQKWLEEE